MDFENLNKKCVKIKFKDFISIILLNKVTLQKIYFEINCFKIKKLKNKTFNNTVGKWYILKST